MAGQLRVDEITNEAGTGSPSFPNQITPASLGTGTPGSGNFLRGDGAWSAVAGITTANWTVTQSGTDLVFSYNGTAVFKITSAGAIVAKDNVTAFGTV
jgi:hypothetical protein